jgi:hypothetical protein
MTLPSPLRVAVAGLTANGLYWTERLALVPDVQVVALYDPHPGAAPGSLVEPTSGWDDFCRRGPFDLLLLDPSIPQRDRCLTLALDQKLPCLLVSCDCTAADLTRWHAEATAAATAVGCLRFPAPLETIQLTTLIDSGVFGPLRLARRIQHSLRPAPPTATATGRTTQPHWAAAAIRSSFDTLRQWGTQSVSVASVMSATFDQQSLVAALEVTGTGPLWRSATSPTRVLLDLDNAARVAHLPGWVLEGEAASYAEGVLYTTSADGEIVDVPQPTLDLADTALAATDPLHTALNHLRTEHRFPVTLPEAALPLAWTEQLLAALNQRSYRNA